MPSLICADCGEPWPSGRTKCPRCGCREYDVETKQTIIIRNGSAGTMSMPTFILLLVLGLAVAVGSGFGFFCCCLPAIGAAGS